MMTAISHLQKFDRGFSSGKQMVAISFKSPGYHTKVPSGTLVHPVITSFEYVLLCLQTREAARIERASEVIGRLLTLQDTVSTNATYGIWPYLEEEPIEAMSPPDWNWADFCGARIAQILVEYAGDFSNHEQAAMRDALAHAALAIFRRNVTPNYTNIAIMGGAVCAAAGEILGDSFLLDYGRRRLENCVRHTAVHGTFNEYNSPAYTPLAMREAERVLQLVRDPACRAAAESLHRTSWEILAAHFHPGTGQWAGPHARAYSDRLDDEYVEEISALTGVHVPPTTEHRSRLWCDPLDLTLQKLPCPPDLIERFRKLPEPEVELRQCFIKRATDRLSTHGTTWMVEEACLGSVSRENFWYQRRPVIGYWKSGGEIPAVLRLRFLCAGRDFCSAYVWNAQSGPRVLSAISLVRGLGYNALHMDVPPGGIFEAEDFRIRVHLVAGDATVEGFSLSSGGHSLHVHPAQSMFGEFPVKWESGSKAGEAWVDGVCYQGPGRTFDFEKFGPVLMGLGMELLPLGEPPSDDVPRLLPPATFEWRGLSVESAPAPENYLWA